MSKTLQGSSWDKHLSHSEPHVAVIDDEVDYLDERQHTAADTETQHSADIIWNRIVKLKLQWSDITIIVSYRWARTTVDNIKLINICSAVRQCNVTDNKNVPGSIPNCYLRTLFGLVCQRKLVQT